MRATHSQIHDPVKCVLRKVSFIDSIREVHGGWDSTAVSTSMSTVICSQTYLYSKKTIFIQLVRSLYTFLQQDIRWQKINLIIVRRFLFKSSARCGDGEMSKNEKCKYVG